MVNFFCILYIIATDAFHVITTVSSRTCKIHIYFIKEPAMQFVFVLQRNEIQSFDMYKVHVYILYLIYLLFQQSESYQAHTYMISYSFVAYICVIPIISY